jgi:hypothetical protein
MNAVYVEVLEQNMHVVALIFRMFMKTKVLVKKVIMRLDGLQIQNLGVVLVNGVFKSIWKNTMVLVGAKSGVMCVQ